MNDLDAAAQLIGKKLVINTDYATPGKLPHEVVHIVFKMLFKDKPRAAAIFKNAIKSSFKGKIYKRIAVKDADGKQTGEFRDMSIEEMIKNEYSNVKDLDKLAAEEYCAYVAEILAEGKYYGEHVAGNVFTGLMQGINRFSNQQTGRNVFGKDLTTKQNLNIF